MSLKSLSPNQYSHTPAAIAANAATISSVAIGRLAFEPSVGVFSSVSDGVGRRACRRIADERRESRSASRRCERMLRSSMQKSRAVLPVLSMRPGLGMVKVEDGGDMRLRE